MSETISLQELFHLIKKRLLSISGIAIISICIGAYVSFYLISPVYEAQTQLLVNTKNIDQEYAWSQMETDLQLINTYNVIMKSPAILNQVIEKLDLQMNEEKLANQIIVTNENDSKVVNVTVRAGEAQQAVDIANTITEVFQAKVPALINVDNITILSAAKLDHSPRPVKPNILYNLIIAAGVGLLGGIGFAFLREIMDTTLKTEKEVEDLLQLPIMGVVGFIPPEERKKSSLKSPRSRGDTDVWQEK